MSNEKRILFTVDGRVQGVGFRPFVFRLATKYLIKGYVKNTSSSVLISAQANEDILSQFEIDLKELAPERSFISSITKENITLSNTKDFSIIESVTEDKTKLVLLPDTSICKDCLQEFHDPSNRRYQYPFIHCMSCGPRFSLFEKMPFDRMNTTMKDFTLCRDCCEEYADPENRRFFSQTTCCSKCGPTLSLWDKNKQILAQGQKAIQLVKERLLDGEIVAIKNTGGFLLLADATNEKSVMALRSLKKRKMKPFAILVKDLDTANNLAYISKEESVALTSHASPIVLLKKRAYHSIANSVASESPYFGIMLAHSGLHHLLCSNMPPLVATSGNISSEPLIIDEHQAVADLKGCNFFLIHNRRIQTRLDDSILQIVKNKTVLLRHARGYVPSCFDIPFNHTLPISIFGAGSQMKSAFAIALDNKLYLSQHIGELESYPTCVSYMESFILWQNLLSTKISLGACDNHPDLFSSTFLEKLKIPCKKVQHHKAHALSIQLEHHIEGPYLAITWDGTGLGDDGTIWGSECFVVDKGNTSHFASIRPFLLLGGEKAVKEPRRSCLGMLYSLQSPFINEYADKVFSKEEVKVLIDCLDKKIRTASCTSMGRFFDAVSSLIGLCNYNEFEGHAAILLEKEALKANTCDKIYQMLICLNESRYYLDYTPMIEEIIKDLQNGVTACDIAFAFHKTIARSVKYLLKLSKIKNVFFTGGVAQNKLLLELMIEDLRNEGYEIFFHEKIPPNDAGIAVGQILSLIYEMDHLKYINSSQI